MLQTIVHRHAIETIVGTDIEVSILVFINTFHGVSVQCFYLRKILQATVGAIKSALGTYPIAMADGIVSQGIDQRLCARGKKDRTVVETESGE